MMNASVDCDLYPVISQDRISESTKKCYQVNTEPQYTHENINKTWKNMKIADWWSNKQLVIWKICKNKIYLPICIYKRVNGVQV